MGMLNNHLLYPVRVALVPTELQTAYAHTGLIQSGFFRHFPESPPNFYPALTPSDTIFHFYSTPNETDDLIIRSTSSSVLLFYQCVQVPAGLVTTRQE